MSRGPGRPAASAWRCLHGLVVLVLVALCTAQTPPTLTVSVSTLGSSSASASFTGTLGFVGSGGWWRAYAPAAIRCRSSFDQAGLCHQVDLYRGNLFIATLAPCANCSAAAPWNSDPSTWAAPPAQCALDPTAATGRPSLWNPPGSALPPCVARADGGVERWAVGSTYTVRLSALSSPSAVIASASATLAIAPAWQLSLTAAPTAMQGGGTYTFTWAAAPGTACAAARIAYSATAPATGAAVDVAAAVAEAVPVLHGVPLAQAAGTYLIAATCATDPSVLPAVRSVPLAAYVAPPSVAPSMTRFAVSGARFPVSATGPRCFPVCYMGPAATTPPCTFTYSYSGGWYDCGVNGGCGLKATGPYALSTVEAQLAYVGPFDASNSSLPGPGYSPAVGSDWLVAASSPAVAEGAAGSIAWQPDAIAVAPAPPLNNLATINPPIGWYRARAVGRYVGWLALGAPALTPNLYLPAPGSLSGGSTSEAGPGALPLNGGPAWAGDLLLVTPVRIVVDSTTGLTAGRRNWCRTGDTCRISFSGLGVAWAAVYVAFGAAGGGEVSVQVAAAVPVAQGAGSFDWAVPCSLRGAFGPAAPAALPTTFQVMVRSANDSLAAGSSECFTLAPAQCCFDESVLGAAAGGPHFVDAAAALAGTAGPQQRGVVFVTARGTVTDGAGAGGAYQPNANCRWAIAANANATGGNLASQRPVERLKLFFTRYSVDATDSLRVYDGLSTSAPLLFDSAGGGFYASSSSASAASSSPATPAAATFSSLNFPEMYTSGPYALVTFASDGPRDAGAASGTQAGGFALSYHSIAAFDLPARLPGEAGPPPAASGDPRAAAFDAAGAVLLVASQPRGGGPALVARYDRLAAGLAATAALALAPGETQPVAVAHGPAGSGAAYVLLRGGPGELSRLVQLSTARRGLARAAAAALVDAGAASLLVTPTGAHALVGLRGAVAVVRTADMALLRSIPAAAAAAAPLGGPPPPLVWDTAVLHASGAFAYFFSSTLAPSRVLPLAVADPAAAYPDVARVAAHPTGPGGWPPTPLAAGDGRVQALALDAARGVAYAATAEGGLLRLALGPDGTLARLDRPLPDALPRLAPPFALPAPLLALALPPPGDGLLYGAAADGSLVKLRLADFLPLRVLPAAAPAPPVAAFAPLGEAVYFPAGENGTAALARLDLGPALVSDGTLLVGALDGHAPGQAPPAAASERELQTFDAATAAAAALGPTASGSPAAGTFLAAPNEAFAPLARAAAAEAFAGRWPWAAWAALFADGSALRTAAAAADPAASGLAAGRPALVRALDSLEQPNGLVTTVEVALPAAPFATALLAARVASPVAPFQKLALARAFPAGVPTWAGADAEVAAARPTLRRGCGYELRWDVPQQPLPPPETLVVQNARLERLALSGPSSVARMTASNGTDLILLGTAPGGSGPAAPPLFAGVQRRAGRGGFVVPAGGPQEGPHVLLLRSSSDSATHGSLAATLAGALIAVSSPAAGDVLPWEVPARIAWNLTAGCLPRAAFSLELWPAGPAAAPLLTIAEEVAAPESVNGTLPLAASFVWTPPSPDPVAGGPRIAAGAYVIVVRAAGDGLSAGRSAPFTVGPSRAASSVWTRGEAYEVQWAAPGPLDGFVDLWLVPPLGFGVPPANAAPQRVSPAALPAAPGRARCTLPAATLPAFYQLEVRTAAAAGEGEAARGRLLYRSPVVQVVAAVLEFSSPPVAGPPALRGVPYPLRWAAALGTPSRVSLHICPAPAAAAAAGAAIPGVDPLALADLAASGCSPLALQLAAPNASAPGAFELAWLPPVALPLGSYYFRAASDGDAAAAAASPLVLLAPGTLTLLAPPSLAAPAPTAPWVRGATVALAWTSVGRVPALDLFACPAATPAACRLLALAAPNTGAASLEVPFALPLGPAYLRIQSVADAAVYDASPLFPVAAGTMSVTWPIRGAVLVRGSTYGVTWTAAGYFRSVRLLLCSAGDGLSGCGPIAPLAPVHGTFGAGDAAPSPTPINGTAATAAAAAAPPPGGPYAGTFVYSVPAAQPTGVYYLRGEAVEDDGCWATTASFTIAAPEGSARASSAVFRMTIGADYDGWTAEARERLRAALAGQLGVPLSRLNVLSEAAGSVVLTIEVLDDRSAGARTAADVAASVRDITAANRWALGAEFPVKAVSIAQAPATEGPKVDVLAAILLGAVAVPVLALAALLAGLYCRRRRDARRRVYAAPDEEGALGPPPPAGKPLGADPRPPFHALLRNVAPAAPVDAFSGAPLAAGRPAARSPAPVLGRTPLTMPVAGAQPAAQDA